MSHTEFGDFIIEKGAHGHPEFDDILVTYEIKYEDTSYDAHDVKGDLTTIRGTTKTFGDIDMYQWSDFHGSWTPIDKTKLEEDKHSELMQNIASRLNECIED